MKGIRIAKKGLNNEMSGFVYIDPDANLATIGLNVHHSKTGQRFTLAHELGHIYLHKSAAGALHVDEGDFFVRFRGPSSVSDSAHDEREANAFAAKILMPRTFLERDFETGPDELSLSAEETFLSELAGRYGVSRQALAFRLINLGLLDAAAFH